MTTPDETSDFPGLDVAASHEAMARVTEEVHGPAPTCLFHGRGQAGDPCTCANRPQFGSPTGGKGIVGWTCELHGPMRHYCDGYGPRKGWCGSASATDCTCAYSHRLHREGYAEGVAVATASIVAWLRERTCHAEGHDERWCGMCSHDDDTADAIERGEHEEHHG